MIALRLLVAIVVVGAFVNAFTPLRPALVQPRRLGLLEMTVSDGRAGKAFAAFTVAAGLFASSVHADSTLKAALKEVKDGAVATSTVTAPAPVPGYKADAYKVPKAAPAKAAAKGGKATAAAPTPVQYTIKPDTELLLKLKAVQKTTQAATAAPAAPAPSPARVATSAASVSQPAAPSASKTAISAAAPASAVPKLPQEVALQAAVNKKAAEKKRLESLKEEVNEAKKQADKYKNEISKYQSKVDVLDRKLQKVDLSRYVCTRPVCHAAPKKHN